MFGSHLSISGSMHNALLSAETLGMDTVQVFTKNQQQWKAKPLTDEVILLWKEHLARLKFTATVSHDSYLINLASPDEKIWRASVDLFLEEIMRCDQLDIPFLVAHPAAHVGSGEPAGLKRIAEARWMRFTPSCRRRRSSPVWKSPPGRGVPWVTNSSIWRTSLHM